MTTINNATTNTNSTVAVKTHESKILVNKKANNYPQEVTFLPFSKHDHDEELRLKVTRTTFLQGHDVEAKRREVLQYFHDTYTIYERLFEPLATKAYYLRADPLRHPLIFYYGHTAVLYINKLRLAKMIKARVNKKFESMFAVGVDEMSWDDLLEDHYDWPTVAEVKAYRDEVRSVVEEAIQKYPLKLPITWDDPFWSVMMGIEHERIHLETSAVLIRQLPLEVLKPHPFWPHCQLSVPAPPQNPLLPVITKPTHIRIGKSFENDPYYGWDNEYGHYEADVPPFKTTQYLVTNQEFLSFVEDGAYFKREYWTEEGWRFANFRKTQGRSFPLFWVPVTPNNNNNNNNNNKTTYRLRLMLEVVDMPWNWPVEVNNLEAKAYCNWLAAKTGKKLRLPTEDEYQILREQEIPIDYPAWGAAPYNVNLEHFASSTPVDYFKPSKGGFYDVTGNVWQHTETPIDPFKGFRVHPFYDDFSVPTFDLQHNLIKGGSWITTGNEALKDSRYAFRRHFYQNAGFRYVESDRAVAIRSDVNERDESVALYAAFHYGPEHFGVANFPQAIANLAIKAMQGRPMRRALDLGCAVGRSSFELARSFEYVLGLDFSARFIRLAVQLKEQGTTKYSTIEEGTLLEDHAVTLSDFKYSEIKDKCDFFQADACNLDPRYTNFDLVLAANLIDELYEPMNFLSVVHDRVNVGGLLVMSSTYNWRESCTNKDLWLGGFKNQEGKEVHTLETMKRVLGKHFKLVAAPTELPFVLRETRRKFQHSVAEVTVWERLAN